MNWIQKHALSVLLRMESASLKDMRPDGVDSNLFSYHIHYLKSNKIIESIARGRYALTTHGMRVVGKFNSATGTEADDVKSVIVLYATRGDEVLLFEWTRHPYFGHMTLPHDRYNYGATLDAALDEAVADKLGLSVAEAAPNYKKSGMIHIMHGGEQVSCMSAHVYSVPYPGDTQQLRNGVLRWVPRSSLASTPVMRGVDHFLVELDTPSTEPFDVTLEY